MCGRFSSGYFASLATFRGKRVLSRCRRHINVARLTALTRPLDRLSFRIRSRPPSRESTRCRRAASFAPPPRRSSRVRARPFEQIKKGSAARPTLASARAVLPGAALAKRATIAVKTRAASKDFDLHRVAPSATPRGRARARRRGRGGDGVVVERGRDGDRQKGSHGRAARRRDVRGVSPPRARARGRREGRRAGDQPGGHGLDPHLHGCARRSRPRVARPRVPERSTKGRAPKKKNQKPLAFRFFSLRL